ncbi:MAG: flagellar hook-associated protein FlgL [Paraperlucidibaca sp.]
MRISTQQIYRQAIGGMMDQQLQLTKTQQQVASGKRFQNASEDPVAAQQSLTMQRSLDRLAQFDKQAILVDGRLREEENAVTSSVQVLQRVRELVVGANNGTQSNESRAATAVEIREQVKSLMQLANSQDGNGHYLFGGYQDDKAPYSFDNATQAVLTNSHAGQRLVSIGPGRQIADGDTGAAVFQQVPADPSNIAAGQLDLFKALRQIAAALETPRSGGLEPVLPPTIPADPTEPYNLSDSTITIDGLNKVMAKALKVLDRGLDHLSDVRTGIGVRLNQIDQQSETNASSSLQLSALKSDNEDIDIAEAYSKLSLQLSGLQAAQKAYVQVQGLSLFNYL